MSTLLQTPVHVTSHVTMSSCPQHASCQLSCHCAAELEVVTEVVTSGLREMMTGWCGATKEQPHDGDNTATVIAANKLLMPLSSCCPRGLSSLEMGSLSWL